MNTKNAVIIGLMLVSLTLIIGLMLVTPIFIGGVDQKTDEYEQISDTKPFNESRSIMDTIVTIEVLDTNETHALESIDRAFGEIHGIDALMSSYKNDSELNILNHQGYLVNANPDLTYVLERSICYSEISDGAFDITIKPILDLWKSKYIPGGTYMPPTPDEISETLKLVDYSGITIEHNNISLRPNMSIVLGGIAKGYSADQAIESLENDGITSAFVNAGGDGRFIGLNEQDMPWKIGLQNPDKSGGAVTIMHLSDMAVATSGNYERYFNDAAKVSHISDPRNGYSSMELISATVITYTAMDADALATTVFVLGEDAGIDMIEDLDGIECLIITGDKRIVRSSGFGKYETGQENY
ncbi:MAG TPA: FAD:protein FMN transferase [Methanosarcinaceae archaeon]|nr:FAD:protein FMN transferase [Methanosarcinaceae archaeon]